MTYQLIILVSAALLVGAHPGDEHSHDGHSKSQNGQIYAVVHLGSPESRDVHGYVIFHQLDGKIHVAGEVHGLSPGKYAFHIQGYNCSSSERLAPIHEFPVLEFDNNRLAYFNFEDKDISLFGDHSIVGKAVALHELSSSGQPDHQDRGIGERTACGDIEMY